MKIWFQNRRNKWKRQLAAELEAANMAQAAQRMVRVPILYHEGPGGPHLSREGGPGLPTAIPPTGAPGSLHPASSSSAPHSAAAAQALAAAHAAYGTTLPAYPPPPHSVYYPPHSAYSQLPATLRPSISGIV